MKRIADGLDRLNTNNTRVLIAVWVGAFMLYGCISSIVDLLK